MNVTAYELHWIQLHLGMFLQEMAIQQICAIPITQESLFVQQLCSPQCAAVQHSGISIALYLDLLT